MVDSIKQAMNRIDIQRPRIHEGGPKDGANSDSVGKNKTLNGITSDSKDLEVSGKVAKLAQQPPIDTETVARIKNAIADGKYPIDIDAVSDALMDAYRDMKS